MAPVQVELLGISPGQDGIDLSMLVKEATWKDVLVDLVHRNQFDPWNIDIVEIVDKYIEAVKALKVMDLRVPANMMLASAVLLRLKSEMLSINEPEPLQEDSAAPFERPVVQVDELSLRLRPQVKRRIALVELIQALEEAMAIKERRTSFLLSKGIEIPITINDADIEQDMDRLYETIKIHADKKNMITFSQLAQAENYSDVVLGLFIPLLFLAYRERVYLTQEEFFGEIIIEVN